MRVTDRGTTLVIRDTPGCLWLFGAWFAAGGLLILAIPFVAENRGEAPSWLKLLILLMGAAAAAVGWATMRRSPTTRTELDAASGRVRVHTRSPFRQAHIDDFALTDIGVVQVLPSRDSEGVEQYSLRLLLRDGRAIPLHTQPSPAKATVERVAQRIRDFLGARTHA